MKPEAFIFDIGNVLVRFDYGRAIAAFAKLGADLSDRAALERLAARYERGAVDRMAFLAELRTLLGHGGEETAAIRAWQEIFEPNLPMWDLVEQLHAQHPLYLLSNTNCLQHDYLLREYAIFEKFADGVYSYSARLAKPERAIFELAIRQFGVRPAATIYLDDLPANVEAARAAGLRAFRYDPDAHGDLLVTLRREGVQCV
ncbi:MAG: HAD family hydrolase [Chthoniobacterales bacterium]|jgi:HAD superfamily hydrolase (TIGR01509 family)